MIFGRKRAEKDAAMLALFQGSPEREFFALDLLREGKGSGVSNWSLYSSLIRLQERGFITSRWADLEKGAKYRRRLYRLAEPC